MVNSIGTAEALAFATERPLDDPATIERGYVQGAMEADRPLSYLMGGIFSSGGAIDWVRGIVGNVPHATLIAEAEAIPPGSNGVVFLPHLANGPPPEPDADARGAFLGMTPATGRAVLYRSVLEGIALQSRLMLDGMTSLKGLGEPEEIRMIGGVSRNRLFVAIKANVFARPIVVVDEAEATALGAALLGGMAAGLFPGLDQAIENLDRSEQRIEPDATAARYDALRAMVFERIHARVQPINRALAEFLSTSQADRA
jgi:xylulokinase